MNVKPFECVEVSTFMVIFLLGVVDGMEGMCVFFEMLCNLEEWLLVRNVCLCSLYLTATFLPVCPT